MRISDWSSDVCSSDLISSLREALFDTHTTVAPGLGPGDHWRQRVARSYDACIPASRERRKRPIGGLSSRQIDGSRQQVAGRRTWDGKGLASPPCREEDSSEEHTFEIQSLIRNSYSVFVMYKKN